MANFETENFTKPLTLEEVNKKTKNRVKILHGSSLLRPLNRQNNCPSAKIPFLWCPCQFSTFIPDDSEKLKPKLVETSLKFLQTTIYAKNPNETLVIDLSTCIVKEYFVKLSEDRRLFVIIFRTDGFINSSIMKTVVEIDKKGQTKMASDQECWLD
uniref:Uncharacterized protein n=1 Tax=Panagrolaimus sp. JU765 TaxID=591449 RepID=A0AC34Q1D8_9BILA